MSFPGETRRWKIKIKWLRFYHRTTMGRVIDKFIYDRLPNRAAGLSFTTLLALVPVVAVILSFGGYNTIAGSIQNLIVKTLLPASQTPILESLNEFAQNSRRLGTWGILVSLVIIVLLLNAIEKTFNEILRTRPSKNFFIRASTYIATLVFGTLLVGASITFTGSIPRILSRLRGVEKLIPNPIFTTLFSIGTITLTLLLMFYILPAGRFRFKSVILGALSGGIAWEIAKQLFSLWATHSVRNSVIYGSFFIIPMMFIWIDVTWIIVLTGLEIMYVKQHGKGLQGSKQGIALPKERIIHSLELFFFICRCFHQRKTPPGIFQLCQFSQLSEESVIVLLQPFLKRKLLYKLSDKDAYLPSTDLRRIQLKEVMHVIMNGTAPTNPLHSARGGIIWDRFLMGGYKELNNKSVEDILNAKDSIPAVWKNPMADKEDPYTEIVEHSET